MVTKEDISKAIKEVKTQIEALVDKPVVNSEELSNLHLVLQLLNQMYYNVEHNTW
jgi:hypothetical protein